jgi:hypothetical protein
VAGVPEEADEEGFCWELEVGGISVWLLTDGSDRLVG